MKTLDRYVVKNFLVAVALCFVALMAIRIAADLFFNMDEFTETRGDEAKSMGEVLREIGRYYGFQSLLYFRELGGVIIVVAATFTVARMNHTNELTAVLASGVSLHRVLLPLVVCAMALNVLVVIDSELLVPRCKFQLVRSRDEMARIGEFEIRTVTDQRGSSWFSGGLQPEAGRVVHPWIILRDEKYRLRGHISAPSATYDPRRRLWVFPNVPGAGPLDQPTLQIPGALAAARTDFIQTTAAGPEEMIEAALAKARAEGGQVDWGELAAGRLAINAPRATEGPLIVGGERLRLELVEGVVRGTVLENAWFLYRADDGTNMCAFRAPQATYRRGRPAETGWVLTDGTLLYASDLTPRNLKLRQSREFLELLSSRELGHLLRLRRIGDTQRGRLIQHTRFADFFNNIILLLVGLPFVLSRERNIKASAGLTVLTVGVVYMCVQFSRHLSIPATLAAWVPMVVFACVAGYVLRAIKT